jgi:hypothetical protein
MPFSGVLASWNFAGQPGNQAATPVTSTAPGIVATDVTRAAGLTAVSGSSSMNSSNWPSAAQPDPTKFYTLTITPPAGCTIDVTSIALDAKASGTGPSAAAVATGMDNFAQSITVSTATPSTPSLAISAAPGAVEIRIYGFGASSTAGTLRVQTTLAITGALK